jgi:hypothetical protein
MNGFSGFGNSPKKEARIDKTATVKPRSDIKDEGGYWSATNPKSGYKAGYHPIENKGNLPMNYTQESYEEDKLHHSQPGYHGKKETDMHAATVRMSQWENQGNKPVMPKL